MRHQNRPQGPRPGNSWRSLWQQLRFPLSVGFALGLVTCTLTTLAFGANSSTIPLMIFIAGSCLVMPMVILAIGNYMESQNED